MKNIKRVISLILCAAMVLSMGIVNAFAAVSGETGVTGNLLENAGFENGKTGWTFASNAGINNNYPYGDHTGYHSCTSSGADSYVKQSVTITESGEYTLCGYVAGWGEFGLRDAKGNTIASRTHSGSDYSFVLMDGIKLQAGDTVTVFMEGGSSWLNGDDIFLATTEFYYQSEAMSVTFLIAVIGKVTLNSAADIKAARYAYDTLPQEAKALVSNLDTLQAAEAELDRLLDMQFPNEPIPQVDVDVYMSDLTWTKNESSEAVARKDKSFGGNTLNIAGYTFPKGIGAHAPSVIEAEIPEGMNRFVAVAGADNEVGPSNAEASKELRRTQYSVYIDGVLMDKSLELPVGYYHVFDIQIPKGAKTIRLVVDPTDDLQYYDHADWGIAGFVAADEFSISVNGGTASVESAFTGRTVTITADAAPEGQVFEKWVGDVEFADASAEITTFPMPARDVSVTAVYRDLIPASGIALNKTEADLVVGGTMLLTAAVIPENADDLTVTWSTGDPSVAKVLNGKVTAVGIGEATITVTTFNGISASCVVTVKANNPFIDVKDTDYFYDSALWAVKEGITVGDGAENTFKPGGKCIRAQVVTFLWRAAGEPEPASVVNPFTDVNETDYYYKAVLWAVEQEIAVGTSETTFSPGAACTRAQVAAFLYRFDGENQVESDNPFVDLVETEYYVPAVLWAVKNGITQGDGEPDTFNPNGTCTRGQIVTFLYRYMG